MEVNALQKVSLQIWVILIVVNNGLILLTIARNEKKDEKKCPAVVTSNQSRFLIEDKVSVVGKVSLSSVLMCFYSDLLLPIRVLTGIF